MYNFADAVRLHRQGDHARARELSARILKSEPRNLQALTLHGTVCAMLGDRAEAIKSFQSATKLRPEYAPYHYMLGNLLREGQQWREAIRHYQQAIHAQPVFIEAWINLGLAFGGCGLQEQEADCYRRVLTIDAKNRLALFNLGNALQILKRYDEAIDCYSRVLAMHPGDASVLFNMGNAQLAANNVSAAIAIYEKIVAAIPDHAPALANLGVALRRGGRLRDARQRLEQSLRVNPTNVQAMVTLGNVLGESGEMEAAIARLERAIQLDPSNADAHFNLGNLLHQAKQWKRSCDALHKANQLKPGDVRYLGSWVGAMAASWDVAGVEATWPLLLEKWSDDQPIPIDVILERTDDPELLRQFAKAHASDAEIKALPFIQVHGRDTASVTGRRPRIAYLSPDFGEHPVGLSLVEVLERHDRSRFEVIGLSLHRHPPSATRNRIVAACERFIEIAELDTEQSIVAVRDLDLDLIVDLAGYTANGHPALLAARCAPVQVSYLGFPGTLSASWIDYIVADSYVIPEVQADSYAERIVRIDDGFFPTDATQCVLTAGGDRAAEGLPSNAFVFCNFNHPKRITAEMMEAWLAILSKVDGSVLWLQNANETARANMRLFAERHGVDPDRLIFARFAETRADHLSRHRYADLYLDTFPYNCQSTARDALVAGVPLLTRSGRSYASRLAGSFLAKLQMPSLIAETLPAYRDRAVELASSPLALKAIRDRLASQETQRLLVDTPRLTANLERAYLEMITAARR